MLRKKLWSLPQRERTFREDSPYTLISVLVLLFNHTL